MSTDSTAQTQPVFCTIKIFAEKFNKLSNKWESIKDCAPFSTSDYSVFAFMAGVRNTQRIKPISRARGIPSCGISSPAQDAFVREYQDLHNESCLSVDELTHFDYMQHALSTQAFGVRTYTQVLGRRYFVELAALEASGAQRIVFWFKN